MLEKIQSAAVVGAFQIFSSHVGRIFSSLLIAYFLRLMTCLTQDAKEM
jgi:hypothetical protein